jgi:putative CocE/NonD family hydrolase
VSRRAAYDVRVLRDIRVPTADPDVTLGADLYLPDGAPPVPALVSVLPYRKDAISGIGGSASLHWFAAHGYASMLVDLRGTGSSDGTPRPPFDAGDADDGVAAVAWAARQPWCTGAVGMWGVSYGAITALRTASRQPRELKAIIPVMGTADPGADLIHPGGSRGCLGPLGIWGMSTLLCLLLPPLDEHRAPAGQARWRERLEHVEPYLLDLHRRGPADPVWRSRAVNAGAITTPAMCVAGWRDLFCDGSIRAYEQIRGPKQLLVGPWMHTPPHESPFHPADFHGLALRWWDRWLAGISDGGREDPAVTIFVQGGQPGWRHLPAWPPPAGELRLAATADGGWAGCADERSPATADRIMASHPPDPSVGSLSGLWCVPTSGFGLPLDQHDDDMRSLTVTGQPLEQPMLLAGRPSAAIWFGRDQPVTRLCVKLTDVDPRGRSTLITSGLVTGQQARPGSARPGQLTSPVEVVLGPTAYLLPAGHRVRVALAEDDFPRLWPAAAASPADAGSQHLAVTGLTLTLPVISPAAGRPATMPPPGGALAGHPPLGLRHEPRWTITRDLAGDGTTVTIGEQTLARTPQRHLLELSTEIAASVRGRGRPSARIRGACTATARTSSGEIITVRAGLHVTEDAAVATGQVSFGDTEVFSRRWETAHAAVSAADADRPPLSAAAEGAAR